MPWFSFKSASTKAKLQDGANQGNSSTNESVKKKTVSRKNPKEQDLQFYTQLAHGGGTKRINTFLSLKDLYTKLSAELEIDIKTIMFCTLNTPKIDMKNLLCGLVVYNDFIFVHVQGQSRKVNIKKEEKSIGITITDNGMGCCFVKRIRPGSVAERSGKINIGDQLVKIGDTTLIGARHYTVANKLKELPVGSNMEFLLIEPRQGFDSNLCPRRQPTSDNKSSSNTLEDGKATVRIKRDGTVQEGVTCSWLEKAKEKVDDQLESYMGIRDLELACTILEVSDDKKDQEDFALELNELLEDFGFPDEFVANVWQIIQDERSKSQNQK